MTICDYGCGHEAKFTFSSKRRKTIKHCCSSHWNQCPAMRQKNGMRKKMAHKIPGIVLPYPNDLNGYKSGHLTAVCFSHYQQGSALWKVRCDCGTEKIIPRQVLLREDVKSCGCRLSVSKSLEEEMVGKHFGLLVVIRRMGTKITPKGTQRPTWLCRCDCGKEKVVTGFSLNSGHTKSCGCRLLANQMQPGASLRNALIYQYKIGALHRGYTWELSPEYFFTLIQGNCFYCGSSPNSRMQRPNCKGELIYNGVDRFDNLQGYTIKNSVPCCSTCNMMKGILNPEEFWKHIRDIVKAHPNGILHPLEDPLASQGRIAVYATQS
jgi:hypothetical protein